MSSPSELDPYPWKFYREVDGVLREGVPHLASDRPYSVIYPGEWRITPHTDYEQDLTQYPSAVVNREIPGHHRAPEAKALWLAERAEERERVLQKDAEAKAAARVQRIDLLAADIRRLDPQHRMGAGELAETLIDEGWRR